MSNAEDDLREDLRRATRALERLAAANATLAAQRDQLAADLVYAEQGVSTWAGAAVKRMQERDAALAKLESFSGGVLPGVRDVVLRFAIEMERTLRANDHKGGWQDEDPDDLFASLEDEVEELERAVADDDVRGNGDVRREAVDVANFAMMLADRSERMGEELPEDLKADLAAVLGRTR